MKKKIKFVKRSLTIIIITNMSRDWILVTKIALKVNVMVIAWHAIELN